MTFSKCYITISTKPTITKFGATVTLDERVPITKSRVPLIIELHNVIRNNNYVRSPLPDDL